MRLSSGGARGSFRPGGAASGTSWMPALIARTGTGTEDGVLPSRTLLRNLARAYAAEVNLSLRAEQTHPL